MRCLAFRKRLYKTILERRMFPMKYTKPVILKKTAVNGAVCGNGSPCGRPCSKRA